MELKGEIILIGEIQEFSGNFSKRNIVLKTNEKYPQEIEIEFINDNKNLIENVKIGDNVTVGINIAGRSWENPQTKETKYFVSIKGWRLSVEGSQEVQEDNLPF